MDLQALQELWSTVHIGRLFWEHSAFSHLEAFSGNPLYCGRGMPDMNKYKPAKEVCALTGLTRKHLYYFHHEKVVQAAAYANYSVAGHDGYKLYDDAAVEKLQQIALYYQLGLKRDEIKELMLAPGYDSNVVLCALLLKEREKQVHIARRIAALEHLVLTGAKNGIAGALHGMTLEELGQTLLDAGEEAPASHPWPTLPTEHPEVFAGELTALLARLAQLEAAALQSAEGEALLQSVLDLCSTHLGEDGIPFLFGVFASILGEGTAAHGIIPQLTPAHGWVVIRYLMNHPQMHACIPCAARSRGTDKVRRKKP